MSALLDRLYHLHWVTGQVARCAQPYLGFYAAFLRPHGFKSLINLRGENADFRWWRTEKRVAQELGIAHFDVKLSSRNLPSRSGLAELFAALDEANQTGLKNDLHALIARMNKADDGTMVVPSEYLQVVIAR